MSPLGKERLLYEDRIVMDPEIMVGKPVVKGTRIPVELVLAHMAENLDLQDLFEAYPGLTIDVMKACLQYAHVAVEQKRKGLFSPVSVPRRGGQILNA